ncbi:hypothetical protein HMPREF9406_3416 [Clostridium sp. HGF2]|nr:hypothetical protein HMPREF9406_3416 [Clostridium sp. HGF2]
MVQFAVCLLCKEFHCSKLCNPLRSLLLFYESAFCITL